MNALLIFGLATVIIAFIIGMVFKGIGKAKK
jgi:hypothetical protein